MLVPAASAGWRAGLLGIFHLAVTAYSLRKLQQLQAGVDRLAAQSMPSEALWSSLDTLQHGMTAQFSEVQRQLAIVIEQQGQILAAIQADQWDRLNAGACTPQPFACIR